MTGTKLVTMINPRLPDNDPIRVPKAVVGGHEAMGWVVADDQGPELPPEAPTKTQKQAAAGTAVARSSVTTEKE